MNGFTKVDNWLFDIVMPSIDPGAFKIVATVYRKTIGWNKEKDKISISQFQNAAGITGRNNVIRAIQAAVDSGFVTRTKDGQSYIYQCQLVTNHNQPASNESLLASNESLPVPVTNQYQELVTNRYTQKDILNTNKDNYYSDGGFAEAVAVYENEIAMITPGVSDKIMAAVDELPAGWVVDAINIASESNKRSWRYIQGILNNWQRQGKQDTRPSKNGNGPHVQQADDESGGFYA